MSLYLPLLGTRAEQASLALKREKNARGIAARPSDLRALRAQLRLISVAQSIADKVDLFLPMNWIFLGSRC
jgi:hypothetical protein